MTDTDTGLAVLFSWAVIIGTGYLVGWVWELFIEDED